MSDEAELKKCAHCNGDAMIDEIISDRDKDSDRFSIICTACLMQTNTYLYESDAIEAWNTRHQLDALQAKYDKLHEFARRVSLIFYEIDGHSEHKRSYYLLEAEAEALLKELEGVKG